MRKIDTYMNDYIEQAMTDLVRNRLMSDEFLDFVQENTKPLDRLMKHTQLSIVDVLPAEEIAACQKIADERGVHLKVRKFSQGA